MKLVEQVVNALIFRGGAERTMQVIEDDFEKPGRLRGMMREAYLQHAQTYVLGAEIRALLYSIMAVIALIKGKDTTHPLVKKLNMIGGAVLLSRGLAYGAVAAQERVIVDYYIKPFEVLTKSPWPVKKQPIADSSPEGKHQAVKLIVPRFQFGPVVFGHKPGPEITVKSGRVEIGRWQHHLNPWLSAVDHVRVTGGDVLLTSTALHSGQEIAHSAFPLSDINSTPYLAQKVKLAICTE